MRTSYVARLRFHDLTCCCAWQVWRSTFWWRAASLVLAFPARLMLLAAKPCRGSMAQSRRLHCRLQCHFTSQELCGIKIHKETAALLFHRGLPGHRHRCAAPVLAKQHGPELRSSRLQLLPSYLPWPPSNKALRKARGESARGATAAAGTVPEPPAPESSVHHRMTSADQAVVNTSSGSTAETQHICR